MAKNEISNIYIWLVILTAIMVFLTAVALTPKPSTDFKLEDLNEGVGIIGFCTESVKTKEFLCGSNRTMSAYGATTQQMQDFILKCQTKGEKITLIDGSRCIGDQITIYNDKGVYKVS